MSPHRAGSINLDLVVPCYNEEEALPETHRQLVELCDSMRRAERISSRSRIYYVDDGSVDDTHGHSSSGTSSQR